LGYIRLQVNDGAAAPGVQAGHLQEVAGNLEDAAGGEAEEVGALRGPAGEDPGERIGQVPAGMHLEDGPGCRPVVSMEPVKHPEVREAFQAQKGRGELRQDLQVSLVPLFFDIADGR